MFESLRRMSEAVASIIYLPGSGLVNDVTDVAKLLYGLVPSVRHCRACRNAETWPNEGLQIANSSVRTVCNPPFAEAPSCQTELRYPASKALSSASVGTRFVNLQQAMQPLVRLAKGRRCEPSAKREQGPNRVDATSPWCGRSTQTEPGVGSTRALRTPRIRPHIRMPKPTPIC